MSARLLETTIIYSQHSGIQNHKDDKAKITESSSEENTQNNTFLLYSLFAYNNPRRSFSLYA